MEEKEEKTDQIRGRGMEAVVKDKRMEEKDKMQREKGKDNEKVYEERRT